MTSSGVTEDPSKAWIPYACSKAAMNYLAGSLPLEEPNVTTVCLYPGIVDTGMQRAVREDRKYSKAQSSGNVEG